MKRYAIRNLDKCTKDCLCLYVCPTGATDTETGQIDFNKCIGCGACADACPSRAITLLPWDFPKEQQHKDDVKSTLLDLAQSKSIQERSLAGIDTDKPVLKKVLKALEMSNRIMGEDLTREAGYMTRQSEESVALLEELLNSKNCTDKDAVKALLKSSTGKDYQVEEKQEEKATNEEKPAEAKGAVKKWRCKVCGYIHIGVTPPDECPICGQPASEFEEIE